MCTFILPYTLPIGGSSDLFWSSAIINARYYRLASLWHQEYFSKVLAVMLQTKAYNIPIPRWLLHQGSIQSWCTPSHNKNDGPFLETCPPDKYTKINTDTSTTTWVYWAPTRCYKGQSRLPSSQIFHNSQSHFHCEGQNLATVVAWSYGSDHICGKTCQIIYALPPGMATNSVQTPLTQPE